LLSSPYGPADDELHQQDEAQYENRGPYETGDDHLRRLQLRHVRLVRRAPPDAEKRPEHGFDDL